MRWGLVPSWTASPEGDKSHDFFRMFNARCETISSKRAFSSLIARRRCVVPISGFYEWTNEPALMGSKRCKQPYYVHSGSPSSPFLVAGLFDVWQGGEGSPPLYTYTLLTTDSGSKLAWLHDRQPVILTTPGAVAAWLDTAQYPSLAHLAQASDTAVSGAFQPDMLQTVAWHPVHPQVNKASFQGADAAAEFDAAAKAKAAGGSNIAAFFTRKAAARPSGAAAAMKRGEKRPREGMAAGASSKRRTSEPAAAAGAGGGCVGMSSAGPAPSAEDDEVVILE